MFFFESWRLLLYLVRPFWIWICVKWIRIVATRRISSLTPKGLAATRAPRSELLPPKLSLRSSRPPPASTAGSAPLHQSVNQSGNICIHQSLKWSASDQLKGYLCLEKKKKNCKISASTAGSTGTVHRYTNQSISPVMYLSTKQVICQAIN